ncbi:MAG: aldolase [Deltaproteobacteria bacterium]|jgi:fructose/tagatose bisphosphate aldolase|nr:aldolase [Deltaproteobacteria bacterium]
MNYWNTIDELKKACEGSLEIDGDSLIIKDESRFRNESTEKLVWNAVFSGNEEVQNVSRWIIWEASQNLGCPSSSIHDLYMSRADDFWKDMTVPAINIRGITYDVSRTIFKTLKKHNAAACIFEIAKSEMAYTDQRPSEYVTCVLGAAIREGWKYPVFIQGDHFQTNIKKFATDPESEKSIIKDLITEAAAAGFYNIDIDTSTLVDLTKPTTAEQQKLNYEVAAEITKHVRSCEPKGVTISVGGEIGEVGSENSTPEELIAFMEGYNNTLGTGITGISKISIQTGTSHGGVPLPDGSIAEVALDFDVIDKLGDLARKQFRFGGVVQHGASTLPESSFDNFPKHQAIEVHLATGFQNTIIDSTNFPKNLKTEIYEWLDKNCASEKKPDQTNEQFYYKTRKKAFGVFKRKLWSLTDNTKGAIMSELARQFDMLFSKLGISDKAELINKYVTPTAVHHAFPKTGQDTKVALEVDDNPNAD